MTTSRALSAIGCARVARPQAKHRSATSAGSRWRRCMGRSRASRVLRELRLEELEPLPVPQAVRAELFHEALFFAEDQGAEHAELVGGGGVDQVARVVGA